VKKLSIKIPDNVDEELTERAREKGVTLSECIRSLLAERLESTVIAKLQPKEAIVLERNGRLLTISNRDGDIVWEWEAEEERYE